jgi:signal transduction histidine kinase
VESWNVAMPKMEKPKIEISSYENLQHILHDLAQPLATVTGLVDLLLLELDERDKVFEEIQLISQQLEKVMTIIADIRRIARDAAEFERNLEPPQTPLS